MIDKGLVVAKLGWGGQRKTGVVPDSPPQSAVCAEWDCSSPHCSNDLLCLEGSSGPEQHPVLAGLRGVLPPPSGNHQSPGVLPAGPFSGPPSHPKVLRAPGGWEAGGCPPHRCLGPTRLIRPTLSPACCSVGLWLPCCSATKRQRFSLRMPAAWSHPAS